MAFLTQLGLVVALSCLAVLAQADNYQEARYINDQDLANLIPSVTRSLDFLNWKPAPTPQPQREPERVRPVYITYRPPKEDRPSYHYPYYHQPYPPYQYWPKPQPNPDENDGHKKPKKPKKPHQKPHEDDDDDEVDDEDKPKKPKYPPFGYNPNLYYPSPSHGNGHPYIIIINPGGHHAHVTPGKDGPPEAGEPPQGGGGGGGGRPQGGGGGGGGRPQGGGGGGGDPRLYVGDAVGRNIAADFDESDDSEAVNTTDVNLPLGLTLGKQRARKRLAQQEALVYLRNYQKGRHLRK